MTDRPIIFSAPMVRALLDGRKTQTRRILKPQPIVVPGVGPLLSAPPIGDEQREYAFAIDPKDGGHRWRKLKANPGDRLWVRETWKPHSIYDRHKPSEMPPTGKTFYAADEKYAPSNTGWKPSIHMPRWASRLTLLVDAVRVQRLQEISDRDALAEGVIPDLEYYPDPARAVFYRLWNKINGPGSWAANPYVAAITFRAIPANIVATAAKGE